MTLLIPSHSPERSKWHIVSGTVVLTALYAITLTLVGWLTR